MAQVTVTVNGRPVREFISQERDNEIADFYKSEMRGFRRTCRRPAAGSTFKGNTTKPIVADNNSIRYA